MPWLALSSFLLLLFFVLKERLELFVVPLSEMVAPLSSLGTARTPMFFMPMLVDTSMRLAFLGFVAIHLSCLTISSSRLNALCRGSLNWSQLN